jgi:[ribosomal protein S18]-alanine N-acetyltransferase
MNISILQTTDANVFVECAELMANSDPWKTLKYDFKSCLKALQGDFKEVYIAMSDDKKLTGFIVLQMAGSFKGYIQSILISQDFRGKGIGTKLMKFSEERIFKVSPNVFMCVSSFNTNAARLYYKLGYEKVGELKDFVVQGYSEILLRKTIASLREFAVDKSKI